MRYTPSLLSRLVRDNAASQLSTSLPLIQIKNATFFRNHPSSTNTSSNPPLFPSLSFTLPTNTPPQNWAIIGPSSSGKTTLLEILRGAHLCFPPLARSFPYLGSAIPDGRQQHRSPARAIQYVGFNGESGGLGGAGTRGAYLSARYESRREDTDWLLRDYLLGRTTLNTDTLQEVADEATSTAAHSALWNKTIEELRLAALVDMPVGNLSNGQTRRARIAKALLGRPEVLLLDEPFMGLDPRTLRALVPLLGDLAERREPRLLIALRPQDGLPDWVTHVLCLDRNMTCTYAGPRDGCKVSGVTSGQILGLGGNERPVDDASTAGNTDLGSGRIAKAEALVEMEGVKVKYGERAVLGDWKQTVNGHEREGLWWTVRRGERWGIFGANGSGKTTVLSLICSDHPQAYSLPLKTFGRTRLPRSGQPGISIFDVQNRIGHSSPEIHAFFPRTLTVRQVVENAWSETFMGKSSLTAERRKDVEACLRWFRSELSQGALEDGTLGWADELLFGGLPFSAQRVALFLRAIVKKPDLVILDEAFSGMDERIRNKCLDFLERGERHDSSNVKDVRIKGLSDHQALICISHLKDEVPNCVTRWMCLPEPTEGVPVRFGIMDRPVRSSPEMWSKIWDTS